jgi:hypothetical protein
VAVTEHHARLGTWLLARLYQGSHLRLLNFMRFKAQCPQQLTIKIGSELADLA